MNEQQPETASRPVAEQADKASPVKVSSDILFIDKKQLKLVLAVTNDGAEDVFLLNRLWTLDEANLRKPDPEQVYRFATKDTLRLLFGLAPLPRLKSVTYRNWPEVTVVKGGATHEVEIVLRVPVSEHNIYFSPSTEENTEPVLLEQAQVFLHWIPTEGVKAQPSSFDPKGFELVSPVALTALKIVGATPQKLRGPVLRRTDDFSRLTLPGEKPEPLRLEK